MVEVQNQDVIVLIDSDQRNPCQRATLQIKWTPAFFFSQPPSGYFPLFLWKRPQIDLHEVRRLPWSDPLNQA
jgi:hypothetical protein